MYLGHYTILGEPLHLLNDRNINNIVKTNIILTVSKNSVNFDI